MKKFYEQPELEIIKFGNNDVITTSGEDETPIINPDDGEIVE